MALMAETATGFVVGMAVPDDRIPVIKSMKVEYLKRTQEYRRKVDKQFSFGGARSDREDAAIPIAMQDRREAGFTEEELTELTQLSSGGPSRETLKKASEIICERYMARRAQKREARQQEARA